MLWPTGELENASQLVEDDGLREIAQIAWGDTSFILPSEEPSSQEYT